MLKLFWAVQCMPAFWCCPFESDRVLSQVPHNLPSLQVCNLLHHFLLKAFPEQYEARAEETRRETQRASTALHCFWLNIALLPGAAS